MTTLNEAKEAIYARFLAQFTGTPNIAFENEATDFDVQDASLTEWVRLTVRSTARAQETLGPEGARKFRSAATVFVQVYTLSNTGVKQGDTLATEARDVFEATSFSGLDFNNGLVRESGAEGRWFQHVAEIDFDYDEIK